MMRARVPLCLLFFVAATFVDLVPAEGQALPADDELVLPGARPARAPREAAAPRRRLPARRRPLRAPARQADAPSVPVATETPAPAAAAATRPQPAGEIVRTFDATAPGAAAAPPAPSAPPAPPARELSCIFQEEEPPEGFPTHGAWVRRRNQFIVACERERTRRAAEARRLREEEDRRRIEEARRRAEEEARRRELAEAEARARREAEERARLEAERRDREDRERRLREEDMIRREQAEYRARREAELREQRERDRRSNEQRERDGRPSEAALNEQRDPVGEEIEPAVEPEAAAEGEELSSEMSRRLEEELDRQEREDRGEAARDRDEEREARERERRSAREARERRAAERAERARGPLPPPILQIEAGLSATTRSQVLDDTGGSTVRFGLTPFASAIGTLRLTPLARLGTGPTGLGIEGTYDRALRMEASLDGKALEASADHLSVMGLYDFRLPGGVVLQPRLGYDLARFELEQNETLSGIVYESIAFAAHARIPVLGDKLLVRFGATMYFLIGLGEAAARYGQSGSASGFSVEGGLEGTVSGHFGYFAILEHTSYSATFRGAEGSDVETTSEDGMTTGLCGARASF